MLTAINQLNDLKLQSTVVNALELFYAEVRHILPHLPQNLEIYFDHQWYLEGQGIGGFAYSPTIMTIQFDELFPDKKLQLKYLRETVFHEAYHIAQGYTGTMPKISALEEAIYEGAATVFEREKAESEPSYGLYGSDLEMKLLLRQVKTLPQDYDLQKWKYYDPKTKQGWTIYKVGTYIIDQALTLHPEKTIVDLNRMTATEILNISGLTEVF